MKLFPKSTEFSYIEKLQSRKSHPFPTKNAGRATEKNDPLNREHLLWEIKRKETGLWGFRTGAENHHCKRRALRARIYSTIVPTSAVSNKRVHGHLIHSLTASDWSSAATLSFIHITVIHSYIQIHSFSFPSPRPNFTCSLLIYLNYC